MTESELIELARRGDRAAICRLYQRHAPRVYATVRRLAADDAMAEDWAQEAWLNAIRALPDFRQEARFATWLHRIAVNSALTGRRRVQRRDAHEQTLVPEVPIRLPGPEPLLRIQLEDALARLPDGMRQVLVLHDVEGYTHEEIGDLLGIASGTSKSQLFKARARMRELLRPLPEPTTEEETCHT